MEGFSARLYIEKSGESALFLVISSHHKYDETDEPVMSQRLMPK